MLSVVPILTTDQSTRVRLAIYAKAPPPRGGPQAEGVAHRRFPQFVEF